MNLIIIGLKLSMPHENNREIFLVRPVKYVVSQASYNPPIKSYEEVFQEQKSHSWKNSSEINEYSLPISGTVFMPPLSQLHMESRSSRDWALCWEVIIENVCVQKYMMLYTFLENQWE